MTMTHTVSYALGTAYVLLALSWFLWCGAVYAAIRVHQTMKKRDDDQ